MSKTDEVVNAMKGTQNMSKAKDGVFIHLSHGHEDPQRVLMAMNMAKMMSSDKDVLLYIDNNGVYTVLKNAEDITYKEFPPLSQLLSELKNSSVKVTVCPDCLKAANKTTADVLDWVTIADTDKFFSFTEGRIITLDY
ncbi:MAG: DsrE family protein [Salinivirgaceae bacterium]|nr:DsrE family protein [Salinivirgaceae bacterium]